MNLTGVCPTGGGRGQKVDRVNCPLEQAAAQSLQPKVQLMLMEGRKTPAALAAPAVPPAVLALSAAPAAPAARCSPTTVAATGSHLNN